MEMEKNFENYLESQGKSKSTVQHYTTYAMDFLAWLDRDRTEPEQATSKEVLSYLNHLQRKGLENQTRNIRLGVIKQFFNWQIDCDHRTENPIQHVKIRGAKHKKLYPILDKQQLEKLYNEYQVPNEDDKRKNRNWFTNYKLSRARNKAVLSLMIHQGLTTPEAENLNLNDLKLKEGKVYIAGSRKSNERTLELKSNQIIELMEYQFTTRKELLKYQESETQKLFLPTPITGREKANETLQIWKGLTKEVKSQNPDFINFKQVRTSVITHWLKNHNLRQVQYMAGHRYVSSTEAYLVNNTEDLQKDIDQFYPF
jgi:site-specific recombinase XerD